MRTRARIAPRRSRRRGSVLLDSLVGVIVLSLAAVAFFNYFPVLHRTHVIGAEEAKATQIAQKMVEQLQLLSPSKLNATTLTALSLIDGGQTAEPFTFSSVPLDHSTNYSPSRALKNGTGTIDLENIDDGSVRVTVTVSWRAATGVNKQVTLGTILGGHRP